MFGLSGSEVLFYGGIAVMAGTAILAVVSLAVLIGTGRRLKRKLEKEYGKPRR